MEWNVYEDIRDMAEELVESNVDAETAEPLRCRWCQAEVHWKKVRENTPISATTAA